MGTIDCPDCHKPMTRRSEPDLTTDVCTECGGVFLDSGELEAANVHLRKLTGNRGDEEIRTYHDGRLVTLYNVAGVATVAQGWALGLTSKAIATNCLELAVYFREPLGVALHVSPDRWWGRLARALGLSGEQDIEVGDIAFDRAFVVQGTDADSVAEVLTEPVRQALSAFVDKPPTIIDTPGRLEVLDNCLLYVEGPYTGEVDHAVPVAARPVIDRLLKLADIIEG